MAQYPAILNESEILLHWELVSLTIYVILLSCMVSVVRSIPWLVPFEERMEVIWFLLCYVQETSEWKLQEKPYTPCRVGVLRGAEQSPLCL